jgi:hypothetical protein
MLIIMLNLWSTFEKEADFRRSDGSYLKPRSNNLVSGSENIRTEN